MTDGMFFGMIVGGVALGVFLAVSKIRGGKSAVSLKAPKVSPTSASGDLAEVMMLISSGRKIEAIKLVRELTGMGLAEAKDAVEKMDREGAVDVALMQRLGKADATPAVFGLDAQQTEQVMRIGKTQGKIEALKYVREVTGLGLKEAKDIVDNMLGQ